MHNYNYHSHTHFSDGKGKPEDFIRQAIAFGLSAYGISDHGPHPYSTGSNLAFDQIPAYVARINELKEHYRGQIEVYSSMEVDYIPDIMDVQHEAIRGANLDYTICSVHHVGLYEEEQKLFNIDCSATALQKGLDHFFGGSPQRLIERYFELTRQMIQAAPPTILGHLDRVKKNNRTEVFFDETASWYRKAVQETLDVLDGSGVIVEVNTKSLYCGYTQAPDPSYWILEQMVTRDIPIHLSSDTHRPERIISAFGEVKSRLRAIGFTKQRILMEGEWMDVPL